ncbi:MATE family efflux transporter [Bradyrhizobium sp. I1.7.5]|uniref:MATE family efflux transporter n=1 Tax=Bradyrhizobium sp. I1.7.5 TaxID=3156363 RepID=UPI003394EE84
MNKMAETMEVPRKLTRGAGLLHFGLELRETAKLALPMILTQVGQIAMMTTDLAFIGRIGADAVAAASLASRVYLVSFTFGAGVLAGIVPLAAQAFGANNLALVRCTLRMGLWAAVILSFPMIVFALQGEQLLLAFGQAPDAARLAQQYLIGMAWGVGPALSFLAIRGFMNAVHQPEPVLWITLGAIPTNALVVYLLVFGKLGLPRLELFGAGLATTIVNYATCLVGLWFATTRHPFREYRILAHFWCFDWTVMRQLVVIGTSSSITSLMGYGLVSAAALLAGAISTSVLAAHQVAVQVSAILFMVPFGISMAAAVRIGHAIGLNDHQGVKRAAVVAMLLGVVLATVLTVLVIAGRFKIAVLFLGESGDPVTVHLAAQLVFVGAGFFITDAVASIASGSLRGLRDTWVPLIFAGIAYWLIGFSLSYVLSLRIGLAAIGIWIGLSIGAMVYAGLLVTRFQLLVSRLSLQSEPAQRF